MSEEYKVVLPKLGESIVSATIVQWFKKEGDAVALDEPLLEVSTDKVNSEIPSPVAGVVHKILAAVDQELQVGETLAIISQSSTANLSAQQEKVSPKVEQESMSLSEESNDFLSPAVLRAAKEKGISLEVLQSMKGTGVGGRVTKQDIESYTLKAAAPVKAPCPLAKASNEIKGEEVERLKMSGMRKAIADNLVKSFYEAPHATLIQEIDITPVMKYIKQNKEEFLSKHGAKLTVTGFIVKALAKALAEFPLLNSSLENDTILVKKQVNVGIAVSIDQGLIVPVIKNCQKLSIPDIAKAVQNVSDKARHGKLAPDDVLEGSVTVTNFGMSGVAIGVPIIRYPEVAIIGIGAIKKKVQVLEDDVLAIRSMMHLSLTFDHRVIDGMYGCAFLSSLQKNLEGDLIAE
jgi:2-oxoglutarate dehydrogenase E2 component (dihydrolipoamide succinyltransferase)